MITMKQITITYDDKNQSINIASVGGLTDAETLVLLMECQNNVKDVIC